MEIFAEGAWARTLHGYSEIVGRLSQIDSVVFSVEGSEDHDNKEHIDLNIQYKAERDKKQYKEGPPRWVSKRKSRSYCFGT